MFCRHPRLSTLPRDLFEGLASFRDLENRIAGLTEELQRGDALEVFVESYLQTHPLFQVKDLWLVGQVPADVRKALNLPRDHKGIDGVFRTRSGTLVPYQVKFRIARPQVSVREVSTFLGLTERAKDRMLISNSDRYAGDIENRDRLRILTGTYFDSLTTDELAAIAQWLKGRPARPAAATPRPHQQMAINDITAALATRDRATAVMACGSGKTLVGLRVAEAIESRTVLVLVPSLALLSQALADWSRDTTWGNRFEYLCVCSDPSVSQAADEWSLRATETPFPVETNPQVVRDFLSRPTRGKVRVVFSTYQSAPVVAKGVKRGTAFDFAIFDEAHKTIGPQNGTFAFALDDRRLRIRKRLFLTATPRTVDIRHKDGQGDFRVVSMDDASVYGQRAYDLSFAEAAAHDIICDYRVVVSTVTPDEISAFALKHGITLVKGDIQATRWVATQIGVARAIHEVNASKVITFHTRIDQAKHFASDTSKGISQFLPDFFVAHVNGAEPIAVRREILAGFRDDRKRLVTNARCLTEGVDLPAVDMVVFSNPRRSRVDIIQAVGRAMRKPAGSKKAVGYVVLPLFLSHDKADDIEAACEKTDWEDIVAVLAALRDHDTRLDDLIREQRIAVGAGQRFDPRAFADRIQVLGPHVSLGTLGQHICAAVVKRLGTVWDLRFGELQAFKALTGHCNVPQKFAANTALGTWVSAQRLAKRRGSLPTFRVRRLETIGFEWYPHDTQWETRFSELQEYKERTGLCDVPPEDIAHRVLRTWLSNQRLAKREGTLPSDRAARLESLGLVWERQQEAWEAKFRELVLFKQAHGHCDVPESWPANPELSKWLQHQRTKRRLGKLSRERESRLNAVGISWIALDSRWERRFEELRAFKDRTGHCNVPQKQPALRLLAEWLSYQRKMYRREKLPPDKITRLEEVGVLWSPDEAAWQSMYESLRAFKDQHGHCDIPKRYAANPALGSWLQQQRRYRRDGKLSAEREQSLAALGVDWDPFESWWQQQYLALVAYKGRFGDCDASAIDPKHRELGVWVSHQRKLKKAGRLSAERIALLEELGIAWDALQVMWERKFAALVRFKETHGHCKVPKHHSDNPELSTWMSVQRRKHRNGTLSNDHRDRLERLGVTWDRSNDLWETQFAALTDYKARHGNCDVPHRSPDFPGLWYWLYQQRKARQLGDLAEDRATRLQQLGVVWKPRRGMRPKAGRRVR